MNNGRSRSFHNYLRGTASDHSHVFTITIKSYMDYTVGTVSLCVCVCSVYVILYVCECIHDTVGNPGVQKRLKKVVPFKKIVKNIIVL